MKKTMKKTTKILFIAFGASLACLAITIAVILGTGILASHDNADTIVLSEQIESIALHTDKASVTLVVSEDRKIETTLNLWADEQIYVSDVAVITTSGSVLTIKETPPTGNFLGLFTQPYELKITIHAPQDMIDNIDWSSTK